MDVACGIRAKQEHPFVWMLGQLKSALPTPDAKQHTKTDTHKASIRKLSEKVKNDRR